MVALARFEADGTWADTWVCDGLVREHLARAGVQWGRLPLRPVRGDSLEELKAVYGDELAALGAHFTLRSADRVRLAPGDARWPALRAQYLQEHRHADAEIRFFVAGSGLFHLRAGDGFLGLLCEAGEWVALPAGTRHGFDAGEAPDFEALRLFGTADGWVAEPTGAVLPGLPLLDAFVGQLLEMMGEEAEG